ncbi:MAG: VOC family protein [Pseudomonadota bacterium]|nr:VOC family protein [Pseudomonadota bacterium]
MALSRLADGAIVSAYAGFTRSVRSLARAADFYCGGLGFRPDGKRLRLGLESIELLECAGSIVAVPPPGQIDTAFQHIAIVTSDMAAALQRLAGFDFRPITEGGAVTLAASAGGVTAFKFRDPDGHPLELIAFPPGTGDPRWQTATQEGPTLGIDHSAIVVADAERSIRYYETRLGFTVSARQTNHGPEQDRLDGLRGTEVDVVALRPAVATTPHLELLAYRSPRPAAPVSVASEPDADLLQWWLQTAQEVAGSAPPVSQDPDGHRHCLLMPRRR